MFNKYSSEYSGNIRVAHFEVNKIDKLSSFNLNAPIPSGRVRMLSIYINKLEAITDTSIDISFSSYTDLYGNLQQPSDCITIPVIKDIVDSLGIKKVCNKLFETLNPIIVNVSHDKEIMAADSTIEGYFTYVKD